MQNLYHVVDVKTLSQPARHGGSRIEDQSVRLVLRPDDRHRIRRHIRQVGLEYVEGDVMLTWEPLYHIGGSQVIVTCLQRGVPMALLERFSASRFWDEARCYRATQMHYLGGVRDRGAL